MRERKFLYVLAPGALLLVWRIYALLARLTPVQAAAGPTVPQVEMPGQQWAAAPAPAPPADSSGERRAAARREVRTDDPRVTDQNARARQPWSRDPFYSARLAQPTTAAAPVSGRPPPAPPWKLTGISKCNGRLTALLGGRLATEGAWIDEDTRVVEIARESVRVSRLGWEYRYRLGQTAVESRRERRKP